MKFLAPFLVSFFMKDYAKEAKQVRKDILKMVHKAQTSHIASNFSAVDIAVVLYNNLKEGDQVFWSAGWKAALIYRMLAKQGKIPVEDLDKFPHAPYLALAETSVNGVLVSGGSMSHGLPIAVGMALGKKKLGEKGTIYCIMSDGEMQEGTILEAAEVAAHDELNNLVVLIDYNKWCAMGKTNEVCDLEPLERRWAGFMWDVNRIDGHDYSKIKANLGAIKQLKRDNRGKVRPAVVICDTIKGKGVSFFENPPEHKDMGDTGHLYHYKYIDEDIFKRAMAELNA